MSDITFANLKAFAQHYLGGNPDAVVTDADTTKGRIVNEAGSLMCNSAEWCWMQRPPADVGLTSGQNYVGLPSDMGRLLSVASSTNVGDVVSPTTLERIAAMRQQSADTANVTYWALEYPDQKLTTEAPGTPRLALYPTPSSTVAAGLTVTYRAKWTTLVNDTDVPNIPEAYVTLLRTFIRAVAYEQDDDREDAIANVLASPLFMSMRRADGSTQANMGFITGGSLASWSGNEDMIDPAWTNGGIVTV